MQMAQEAKNSSKLQPNKNILADDLTTVFVVSGPAATGKTELCTKLIEVSDGKLVGPTYLDKIADPITFEQLESRGELLSVDSSGRYTLTKDTVMNTAGTFKNEDGEEKDQILVIDADVALTKKLTQISGI